MCEICSNLKLKKSEQQLWRRFSAFLVNFEESSHIVLVFLLLTLKKQMRIENECKL